MADMLLWEKTWSKDVCWDPNNEERDLRRI